MKRIFGNGSKPSPAGHVVGQVPIVGQPCTFKTWFPTVLVQCNCEAKTPLMIIGTSVVQCPACKRRLTVAAITWTAEKGLQQIGLTVVMTPEEAEQESRVVG